MLNPRALKLFHLIADKGSLAAAASEFNLSPPAASRLISILEYDLGFAIFSREGRNLTLTEEGRQFLRETRPILTSFESIDALANQIRAKTPPQLRVLSTAPFAASWIAPAMSLLLEKHPNLKCNIEIVDWHSLQESLGSSGHDISISSFPISSSIYALDSTILCHFRNVAVMHKSHPLASMKEVSAKDLADQPIVGLQKTQIGRQRMDEFFTENGIEITPHIETSSSIVSLALCRQNLGIAIMPAVYLNELEFPQLVARPIAPERWITFGALTAKANPLTKVQSDFLDYLKSTAKQWEWAEIQD